jgi:hypothetical protein
VYGTYIDKNNMLDGLFFSLAMAGDFFFGEAEGLRG